MAASSRFGVLAATVVTPVVSLLGLSATYAGADTVTIAYTDLGSSSTVSGITTAGPGLLTGVSPVDAEGNFASEGRPGATAVTASDTSFGFGKAQSTVGGSLGGQTLIYNISPTNISELDFYFAWENNGRNAAAPVTIYVNSTTTATTSDPGWTLLTASNAFSPGGVNSDGSSMNADQNEISFTDDTTPGGTIASGVESIEFDFGAVPYYDQYDGLNQIAAFGTAATPEPASASLIVLGAISLLRRRRRVPA